MQLALCHSVVVGAMVNSCIIQCCWQVCIWYDEGRLSVMLAQLRKSVGLSLSQHEKVQITLM